MKEYFKNLVEDKSRIKYIVILGILLLVSGLFLSSKMIHNTTKPISTTKIGTQLAVKTSSNKIVFEKSTYYKKSQLLEASFYYKSPDVVITDNLYIDVYDGIKQQRIEAQLEKINANYYVLFVPNVSSDFKQIVANVFVGENAKSKENVLAVAITKKNTTTVNEAYKTKTTDYFIAQYKELATKDINSDAQNLDKKLVDLNKQIATVNDQNKELVDQMKFKTGDQQSQIQSQIDSNNTQITSIQSQIDSVNGEKKQLDVQKQALNSGQ